MAPSSHSVVSATEMSGIKDNRYARGRHTNNIYNHLTISFFKPE